MRRIQAGQAMGQMVGVATRLGPDRAVAEWANWTDRVAAGETPKPKPPRPQGVERNVVLTLWDWGDQKTYLHDLIATDRRKPTVNANGKIYGTQEHSSDLVPVLDPVTHTASTIKHPVLDPKTPSTRELNAMTPSAYWGDEPIWTAQADNHNPMMDEQGRLWFTVRVRPPANNPAFCRQGSDHPSAKVFPLNSSTRQTSMYDPATGKFTLIDLCFPTHHLSFGEDADNTLWFSSGVGGLNVAGWLNRRIFEQTGDHAKAQGWSPFVLDTNGNGRRDDGWVQPNQPVDPAKDKRVAVNFYSVVVNPQDGTVWGQALSPFPSYVVRFDPKTQLSEIYSPPSPGYGGRGGDIDRNGVFWTSLASGHLGEFDRRKCKVLNGPTATGDHCPEGWTLHRMPGPTLRAGRRRRAQRRGELLHLGRLVQHQRARRERADRHRQHELVAARVREGQVGQSGGAVSDGLLHQMGGRPHRRCRTPAGRAGACGPPIPTAPCSISKAARRTARRW